LNVSWTERSMKTLEQLRELKSAKEQDRLDYVKTMRFAFAAMGQSLAGWMQWVNSPEIMSTFNRDELEKMAETIMEMTEKFIEYDIKITDEGMRKGFAKQREQDEGSHFVI
jgi:hypothetical protein